MHRLLFLHLIISLLYLVYWLKKKNHLGYHNLIIVTVIPLFGIMYIILLKGFAKLKYSQQGNFNFEDTFGGESDLELIRGIDYRKEVNVIPMEEALILNNSSIKRTMVVDMIKKDIFKHINLLKKALKDEDTETSHYAATAITEIKRELTIYMQELASKYNNDKSNEEILTAYAKTLKKYIKSGLLDRFNYSRYLEMYQEVLSNLLCVNNPKFKYFTDIIDCCLERRQINKAQDYCQKFKEAYPMSEKYYLAKLKICYVLRDRENFSLTLKEMKSSNLKLSNKGLNVIRYWSEVV